MVKYWTPINKPAVYSITDVISILSFFARQIEESLQRKPTATPCTRMDRFDTTRLNKAPRCHARSKRSGLPCRAPAVTGYRVCRMHGARGGAPTGKRNGNYRHGQATTDARCRMAKINYLGRMLRQIRREEECRRGPAGSFHGKCPPLIPSEFPIRSSTKNKQQSKVLANHVACMLRWRWPRPRHGSASN